MNLLKFEKINICNCDMCTNYDEIVIPSILQRIIRCNCSLCIRHNNIPYISLTCVELHLLYYYSHDLALVKDVIIEIKKNYLRKKRKIIISIWFIGFLSKLYRNVKYMPGNSGYLEAYNSFQNKLNYIFYMR